MSLCLIVERKKYFLVQEPTSNLSTGGFHTLGNANYLQCSHTPSFHQPQGFVDTARGLRSISAAPR